MLKFNFFLCRFVDKFKQAFLCYCTQTHIYTCTQTHIYMYTDTQIYMYTYTHIYMYTQSDKDSKLIHQNAAVLIIQHESALSS